ncbi:uncharacterized protein N7482_004000 [Penicillium canariense]|uniref:FAD-binding domain-containing protein n=1 Tax=Penicillium canariense TaxID=189055 RepID=A0A9W9I7K0_9EURO|nr:uncharacterized protein N7482_004000 [Penicillium canariense]KAJ5168406.1 hypothetical protein N7482_004000 [Penicillium canariense]
MSLTRIAIVGGGPVGLTLARLLLNKPKIEVVVFESENSQNARGQGGSLDLHPTTGIAALKEAGLYDEFLKRARFEGEALTICDKHLTKYVELAGSDEKSSHGRPEIDRKSLREMLLDSIPPDMIRWGHHLRTIDENHNLIFDHGIEMGFDLIVGAEGAWSKTRKLVSEQAPDYAGISAFTFEIPNAKETAPECYQLSNHGSLFSYSDGRSIMSQCIGDGRLKVAVYAIWPKQWAENPTFDINDLDATRKAILEECHDWSPELLQFVRNAQDPEFRPLYMLPVGWSWENRPGVTLIGDAAHVMTPFAGEGVNLGMQDALKLSRAIIKGANSPNPQVTLPTEIKAYEDDLFVRAKETSTLTSDMMNWLFFSGGSLGSVIEKVALRRLTFYDKSPLQRAKYPLMWALIYGYYFLFKLQY